MKSTYRDIDLGDILTTREGWNGPFIWVQIEAECANGYWRGVVLGTDPILYSYVDDKTLGEFFNMDVLVEL